jgi:hypothetical protein
LDHRLDGSTIFLLKMAGPDRFSPFLVVKDTIAGAL